jgi:hypothetical protein
MSTFDQDDPMDVYPHRMSAAHARKARRIGKGNESRGVRIAVEAFGEQRRGERRKETGDRRKAKKVKWWEE